MSLHKRLFARANYHRDQSSSYSRALASEIGRCCYVLMQILAAAICQRLLARKIGPLSRRPLIGLREDFGIGLREVAVTHGMDWTVIYSDWDKMTGRDCRAGNSGNRARSS
jgi:hypothetical protein